MARHCANFCSVHTYTEGNTVRQSQISMWKRSSDRQAHRRSRVLQEGGKLCVKSLEYSEECTACSERWKGPCDSTRVKRVIHVNSEIYEATIHSSPGNLYKYKMYGKKP